MWAANGMVTACVFDTGDVLQAAKTVAAATMARVVFVFMIRKI
jgi:hypothetical protein